MRAFALGLLSLLFTGCVTHYVIEGTCRLQVGNDTENYTVQKVSIVSKDSSETVWIRDEILPGEKSKVVERDLVGNFTVHVQMDALDTTFEQRFDAGSVFLQIRENKGVVEFKVR